MEFSLLTGTNPVLARELRVALRNPRTFLLLALYIAVLGAIVVSQFPSDTSVAQDQSAAQLGRTLFWKFCYTQTLLVVVLFPALGTGMIAQERERRTLEPLLLTPLSPQQIVWGKAGGVLALALLVLSGTLPLTSLCFLLGGVSPSELVAVYAALLGLSFFATGLGVYCSAKWTNATQATVACYLMLTPLLATLCLFSCAGALACGAWVMVRLLGGVIAQWGRWKVRFVPARWGVVWWSVLAVALLALLFRLLVLLASDRSAAFFVTMVFGVTTYLIVVTRLGLQAAAREMIRSPDPTAPLRERLHDFRTEVQRAVAPTPVVFLPATGGGSYGQGGGYSHSGSYAAGGTPATAGPAPAAAPPLTTAPAPLAPLPEPPPILGGATAASHQPLTLARGPYAPLPHPPLPHPPAPRPQRPPLPATYGVQPFLSDRLNPVFAKDLRAGLAGKFSYLLRFSYLTVIGTELFLLLLLVLKPDMPSGQEQTWFVSWAKFHLMLVLMAGAWLGARAIAPEREQQTLPQLLTTPLSPSAIVRGKMLAVMVYTFYIFVMGVPLALFLPSLKVLPWRVGLTFTALDFIFGATAAAWGLFCSVHCVTVRRALSFALGGVLLLTMSDLLLNDVLVPIAGDFFVPLFPFRIMQMALAPAVEGIAPSGLESSPGLSLTLIALALYSGGTLLLLVLTGRAFKRYAEIV